ncbi:uncharacterized protein [Periplaneta americana]|uniref:uncharacterized protein n=1 Tax=Periplaneta americana TaxID=6978 RepID=UPI0037E7CFB9
MSLYSQAINKRQKTTREINKNLDSNEFFPGMSRVDYRPDAGPEDTLCFRYYNASERIHGRTMEEWLRPSVSFSHAFCYMGTDLYGQPTFHRTWDDGSNSIENYKRRLRAAFEFFSKLGNKYWTLYDQDIAPEGDTLEDTIHNLDEVTDLLLELQQRTGVKPLWISPNLHSHPRYRNGAVTSSEFQTVAFAGAQLKKGLELAHKFGAECFLFRGIREGYTSVLNTDMPRELRNYSRLLKMTQDYKERLGYRGQLLLDSNCSSDNVNNYKSYNTPKYHYNWDAMSSLAFLKHHSLDRYYKLSVSPGHQFFMTSVYGMLGSLDITSVTSPNIRDATLLMKTVIEQGGMQPGGLNIGVPLHRGSVDLKDLMVVYVNYIDIFARGLRNAAKIVSDGVFTKNLQQQYLGFHTGFGSRLSNGEASLDDCDDQTRRHPGDMTTSSTGTEYWEAVFSHYI